MVSRQLSSIHSIIEEHEASQLEHTVFDAARHADVEDVLHQAHIEVEAANIGQVQH